MKHTLFNSVTIISFLFFFSLANSYAQECVWARSAGARANLPSGFQVNTIDPVVTTDASGNVYVAGNFEGDTTYFGSAFVVNTDSLAVNIFVAKYDSSGTVIWVKSFGGIYSDAVGGITADNAGNVYITGTLESPNVIFGATTIADTTSQAVFLVKLNGDGNVIWAESGTIGEGSATGGSYGVATDNACNVYITGAYQDSIIFGSTKFVHFPELGSGVFVAKYDSSGNLLWANSSNGAGDDGPAGIAVDGSGNVYVTGSWTSTTLTFGSVSVNNTYYDNNLFFLVKYNTSGTPLWAVSTGDSNFVGGSAIKIDNSGNIIVAGNFSSPTVTFGTTTLYNADITGSTNDIFLVKFNSAGNVVWANRAGGTSEDDAYAVTTDETGNIYIGGMFISIPAYFGTDSLSYIGMFIAKYNANGNIIWVKSGATYNSSGVSSLVLDGFNNLYAVGTYNSDTLMLDFVTLNDAVSPYIDMFLARYGNITSGIPIIEQNNIDLLYPNPTTGMLNIYSISGVRNLEIFNIWGRSVYQQSCDNDLVQLDVSELSPGVYFVKINGYEVRKFVKQ